jgi:hypothetical protein
MNATPPAEFAAIGLHGEFHKATQNEWHGPCPMCGGKDRFVIFTDRNYPSWNWFCRVCHPEHAWIDELNPRLKAPLSTEQKIEYARQAEQRLAAEIKRAQSAIEMMRHERRWLEYHASLDQQARAMWESWGVPEFWQDYWKLGYDPDHIISTPAGDWHTATMTIPIFEPLTWQIVNIRHRLMNPPRPGDKYRPERAGLPAAFFVAEPERDLSGQLMLVEGEKKAMVTFITADSEKLQVIGAPGKNLSPELIKQLRNAEPIYILLDPDAAGEASRLARAIGPERCRVIDFGMKIDDAILAGAVDKSSLRCMARAARKVK